MKVMDVPGINKSCDSGFITETNADGSQTFIKFMSDAGVTDAQNGLCFAQFMRDRGHEVIQLQARSCTVDTLALKIEFDTEFAQVES